MSEKFLNRDSNTITISVFYETHMLGKYNYNPPCQRKSVWNLAKKSFLIDSIIKNYPIPPIFLRQQIDEKTGKTKYDVIDGKQRLLALIDFIENKISLPDDFGSDRFGDERLNGLNFKDLDEYSEYKKRFWKYVIPIEYLDTESDEVIDSVFDRLNRNGEPLTKQELRKAQYHDSGLLILINVLSELSFWKERLKILDTDRMEDQEFISELLFMQLEQEMFDSSSNSITLLDELYKKWYDKMEDKNFGEEVKKEFTKITDFLNDLNLDFEKHRIGGVSHLYGLWCFAEYCVHNLIPLERVKEPIHEMYELLRNGDSKDAAVELYKKSMQSNTKTKSSRSRRLKAMLQFCGLIDTQTMLTI